MMATTVPGGRYRDAQGNWKDAEGRPIDPPSEENSSTKEESAEPKTDATSAAAELADEHDIDLSEVEGSGEDGRITKPDVEAIVAEISAEVDE